jgi:oligoribonuclease NrnB/cAMP/cGMP phosphodiesterase (DHH superfamily)
MGYNVIDLINKAINIAIKEKTIYENIGKEKCNIPSIKIMSKVLIQEVDKNIHHNESLKKELADLNFEEIDFGIYDKISFLINQFNAKIYVTEVVNVRDFLKFSLDFQKDVYSLLIDIQGRFVKNTSDTDTRTYKILSDMVNNKTKHIAILEKIWN